MVIVAKCVNLSLGMTTSFIALPVQVPAPLLPVQLSVSAPKKQQMMAQFLGTRQVWNTVVNFSLALALAGIRGVNQHMEIQVCFCAFQSYIFIPLQRACKQENSNPEKLNFKRNVSFPICLENLLTFLFERQTHIGRDKATFHFLVHSLMPWKVKAGSGEEQGFQPLSHK